MPKSKFSRRDFITAGGAALCGLALFESAGNVWGEPTARVIRQTQVGPVFVKRVKFTADIKKVSIHKFQQKCALQLGDPDHGTVGIQCHADVVLALDFKIKGKRDYGSFGLIQNVNCLYKRTPPVHPNPHHKLTHECSSSKGNWYLDGQIPYLGKSTNGNLGLNTLSRPDSPGVFLEEGPIAFEDVQADCQFRTYLVWFVGRAEHVLGRIDWSWKGRAIATGTPRGSCVSGTLHNGWVLTPKSADQHASPAVIGAAVGMPVAAPVADPTKWDLC